MTIQSTLTASNLKCCIGYRPFKSEELREFRKAAKAKEQEERLAFQTFKAEIQKRGAVRLTDEQLEHLTSSYDPKNMTRAEYQAFVDNLCEYGILSEGDKDYLSYGELVPAHFLSTVMCTTTPYYAPYTDSFSSSGGNVLEWSKYLSTFESFNPDTKSYEKTRSAILFKRIQDVFDKMGV